MSKEGYQPTLTDIEERLRGIVVRAMRLNKQPSDIEGRNIVSELGVTSLDALEILINVEEEFGVEIADEDLSAALVSSLGGLAAHVDKLTRAAQAPGTANASPLEIASPARGD